MSFLSSLFKSKSKYNDEKIRKSALRAIEQHPMLKKLDIIVQSQAGNIVITGKVPSPKYKNKVEQEIKSKLSKSLLEFQSFVNELEIIK